MSRAERRVILIGTGGAPSLESKVELSPARVARVKRAISRLWQGLPRQACSLKGFHRERRIARL